METSIILMMWLYEGAPPNPLEMGKGMIVSRSEAGSIAPIGVVMLPEALAFAALAQHLNGKRGARF